MGHDAERRVFDVVRADKDVDGFHATNVGYLVQNRATLVACTPSGVIEVLERSGIPIAGARAVVIGRSDIVGKPMALLLLHRHATVTIAHSKTADLPALAAEADILVAAIGRPGFVTKPFVKPGATVIDVGINRLDTKAAVEKMFPGDTARLATFDKRGSMLVGDVHPNVADIAGALTPVPGGVGPLTIALLLRNTLRAAQARTESSDRQDRQDRQEGQDRRESPSSVPSSCADWRSRHRQELRPGSVPPSRHPVSRRRRSRSRCHRGRN